MVHRPKAQLSATFSYKVKQNIRYYQKGNTEQNNKPHSVSTFVCVLAHAPEGQNRTPKDANMGNRRNMGCSWKGPEKPLRSARDVHEAVNDPEKQNKECHLPCPCRARKWSSQKPSLCCVLKTINRRVPFATGQSASPGTISAFGIRQIYGRKVQQQRLLNTMAST